MSSNYIRPMSKHQSNNNTNQNQRRQNFSSPNNRNRQQPQQQTQTSLSPYPPRPQQQHQQQHRQPRTPNRQQPQQQRQTQNDYRYEPAMGNNGTIYHRPYHYPTDERPWAFGPPVYQDEWGNPTNVPVSNWDRAKDMGVDMLEGGMRGMFYAGFRYLERRIFQS